MKTLGFFCKKTTKYIRKKSVSGFSSQLVKVHQRKVPQHYIVANDEWQDQRKKSTTHRPFSSLLLSLITASAEVTISKLWTFLSFRIPLGVTAEDIKQSLKTGNCHAKYSHRERENIGPLRLGQVQGTTSLQSQDSQLICLC